MQLRPYQEACVSQVIEKWNEFHRLLVVLPTGAGKTIIFSNIASRIPGKVLIIAHREELLNQAIDKLRSATGLSASLERAESRADRDSKVVVGSIQTLCRRFREWDPTHFSHIIIDETHHVAAESYQSVIRHFIGAKVLGVTATPDRADHRSLGDHFDEVAFELTLADLIKDKFLSPIRVRVCDVSIDLTKVAIRNGDFDTLEVGNSLEPCLGKIVDQIIQYGGKKVLVFMPLIHTSKLFTRIAESRGLNVRHVDGESENRQDTLHWFKNEEKAILSNAMLLTEGYDEPSIDTIVCLRPTKSRALYTQIVGRGTRLHPGKGNLLILDFLWMTGKHRLIRPTSLFASGEVEQLADQATQEQGEFDPEEAVSEATKEREAKLAAELAKKHRMAGRYIDPLEFGLTIHDKSLIDYEPTMKWHQEPITEKQEKLLLSFGFNPKQVKGKGHASQLLSSLFSRREMKLATPKQVRFLNRAGHKNANTYTFNKASELIDKICKRSSRVTPVPAEVSQ